MGRMIAMNHTGDRLVSEWKRGDDVSEALAASAFKDHVKAGFTMFVDDPKEPQGRKLDSFDPKVEGIVAVPRLQGG